MSDKKSEVPASVQASAAAPASPTNDLSVTSVTDALKKQIEYYFSKENLSSDAYLMSQMDAQMSVAMSVIMKVSFSPGFCQFIICLISIWSISHPLIIVFLSASIHSFLRLNR